MTNLTAERTLDDVLLCTFARDMSRLVTLEAELFTAFERIMAVLSAENAAQAFPLVWAFSCHVTEFLAVSAFDRGIGL